VLLGGSPRLRGGGGGGGVLRLAPSWRLVGAPPQPGPPGSKAKGQGADDHASRYHVSSALPRSRSSARASVSCIVTVSSSRHTQGNRTPRVITVSVYSISGEGGSGNQARAPIRFGAVWMRRAREVCPHSSRSASFPLSNTAALGFLSSSAGPQSSAHRPSAPL